MAVNDPQFPVLKLTDTAWTILRNKQHFEMISQQTQRQPKFQRSRIINTPNESFTKEPDPRSEALFQRLRELRKAIAASENLPPYIVFSDKSLREMSMLFPKDRDAFLQINGVGRRKWESYGETFLTTINDFCRDG